MRNSVQRPFPSDFPWETLALICRVYSAAKSTVYTSASGDAHF